VTTAGPINYKMSSLYALKKVLMAEVFIHFFLLIKAVNFLSAYL